MPAPDIFRQASLQKEEINKVDSRRSRDQEFFMGRHYANEKSIKEVFDRAGSIDSSVQKTNDIINGQIRRGTTLQENVRNLSNFKVKIRDSVDAIKKYATMEINDLRDRVKNISGQLGAIAHRVQIAHDKLKVNSIEIQVFNKILAGGLTLEARYIVPLKKSVLDTAEEGTIKVPITVMLKDADGNMVPLSGIIPDITPSKGTVAGGDISVPTLNPEFSGVLENGLSYSELVIDTNTNDEEKVHNDGEQYEVSWKITGNDNLGGQEVTALSLVIPIIE